mmetsp:Transcript_12849/g.32765  ORF Transcript_12849/g.32765 Transcript_12849/m.32765 type:complete len:163 (+) Transcript_12849:220-708(+)
MAMCMLCSSSKSHRDESFAEESEEEEEKDTIADANVPRPTFFQVLQDPTLTSAFAEFLEDNKCSETLSFILDAVRFKESDPPYRELAEDIWKKYFEEGGEEEISIPAEFKFDVQDMLEAGGEVPVSIFDDIYEEVIHNLRTSVHNRFTRSPHFLNLRWKPAE